MGFWDKVKAFFTGQAPEPSGPAIPEGPYFDDGGKPLPLLDDAVLAAVQIRIDRKESFTKYDIVEALGVQTTPGRFQGTYAANAVVKLEVAGALRDAGYEKLWDQAARAEVYAPIGTQPAGATPAAPPRGAGSAPTQPSTVAQRGAGSAASRPVTPSPQLRSSVRDAPDPYEAKEILGLSREEMRARSLKITPWKTAWIGRVDTIPPQSDERTALIDRGLILRGFLSEPQIREIHRVGDVWLVHHESAKLVDAVARKEGDAAREAAKKERQERRERKRKEAAERRETHAADIARRRREDIVFLGARVSGRLADRRAHIENLERRKLPILSTPADVAVALGLTVPELRWLCYHSECAERTHYVQFEVPKRSGGTRLLAAPHEKLDRAQRWVLDSILRKLEVSQEAHGFVPGRSTVTNARAHLGRDVVVNLDLADFFPTITFPRVRGFLEKLGYSPAVATILALLCTESPRRRMEYDGKPYWVAIGPRGLPQGACTSPDFANHVARRLDRRLAGMAKKHALVYTRYADDLTFSLPKGRREDVPMLLARVRHIVEGEGFALNPKKGRVQRCGGRQTVTGIVVNERPGLPREERRKLRAILHQAKSTGLAAQNRIGVPHFESWLRGKIAYLKMIEPSRGEAMRRELDALS